MMTLGAIAAIWILAGLTLAGFFITICAINPRDAETVDIEKPIGASHGG